MSESNCRSVVPEKYRLQLQPRHLSAGFLDVYDILELTGVQDKELDHAAKKILCSGRRNKGSKRQDVEEAIVALRRYLERNEEAPEGCLCAGRDTAKAGHLAACPVVSGKKYPEVVAIMHLREGETEEAPGAKIEGTITSVDTTRGPSPYSGIFDQIGAHLNADSIRYDWGEDDAPVRQSEQELATHAGGDLLEGTSPLCAHGFNFESCDRCWDQEKTAEDFMREDSARLRRKFNAHWSDIERQNQSREQLLRAPVPSAYPRLTVLTSYAQER